MIIKTDTLQIRILELIGLLGEATSDEIKSVFCSPKYTEKVLTAMKKDGYIKNHKSKSNTRIRLRKKGKQFLAVSFAEIFNENSLKQTPKSTKRLEDRRKKLLEIIKCFYRADVKVFPDEKILLKNEAADSGADPADYADIQPEFYTSKEIKNIVKDYKKGIGSRALGILISNRKIYIVYLTNDGNMLWQKSTERDFLTNSKITLSKMLFGTEQEPYLLVMSGNKKVPVMIMKRNNKAGGKIYPCIDLPNMIFALNDTSKDSTLNFILSGSDFLDKLDEVFKSELIPDKKYLQYDGVIRNIDKDASGNIVEREVFGICAFRFDLRKIADGIESAINFGKKVVIFCFDYQCEYIKMYLKSLRQENNHNIEILSNSIEGYKEDYLK